MPSRKPRRPKRSTTRGASVRQQKTRNSAAAAVRSPIRPPEAWITDPQALLAAMAAGDQAQHEAVQPLRAPAQACPTPAVEEPAPAPVSTSSSQPRSETASGAWPCLREDERVARASESGVVVIVRRRPAA